MGPNTLFEPANTLSADSYCNTPSIRGRSCDVSARERLVASWFAFARAASARRWSTAVVAWKMDFSEGVRESMNSETAEAKGSSFLVLARDGKGSYGLETYPFVRMPTIVQVRDEEKLWENFAML
jgi:hypothetical protein